MRRAWRWSAMASASDRAPRFFLPFAIPASLVERLCPRPFP
jgi:hypothetical protein